jgi:hypothetical protein
VPPRETSRLTPATLAKRRGPKLRPAPLQSIKTGEISNDTSAEYRSDTDNEFILAGRREVDGLPWVGEDRLIPLKASAWLDLGERQAKGEPIEGLRQVARA